MHAHCVWNMNAWKNALIIVRSLSLSFLYLYISSLPHNICSSDRKKLLSSNEVVSPIRGPPSFVQPPRASPSTPTLPQTISRPTFPQFFPVLPTAAVPVPCSDSAASSPGNPGRIRQIGTVKSTGIFKARNMFMRGN